MSVQALQKIVDKFTAQQGEEQIGSLEPGQQLELGIALNKAVAADLPKRTIYGSLDGVDPFERAAVGHYANLMSSPDARQATLEVLDRNYSRNPHAQPRLQLDHAFAGHAYTHDPDITSEIGQLAEAEQVISWQTRDFENIGHVHSLREPALETPYLTAYGNMLSGRAKEAFDASLSALPRDLHRAYVQDTYLKLRKLREEAAPCVQAQAYRGKSDICEKEHLGLYGEGVSEFRQAAGLALDGVKGASLTLLTANERAWLLDWLDASTPKHPVRYEGPGRWETLRYDERSRFKRARRQLQGNEAPEPKATPTKKPFQRYHR